MEDDKSKAPQVDEAFRRLNDGVEAALFPNQRSPGVNRLKRGVTTLLLRMFELGALELTDDISDLPPNQVPWQASKLRDAIRQAVAKTTGETLPPHEGDPASDCNYLIALGRAQTYLLN